MNGLAQLLATVEAAPDGGRPLDHAVYEALRPSREVYASFAPADDMDKHWYWMVSREYSTSIDAALALVEHVKPHSMWRLQCDPDSGDGYYCSLVIETGHAAGSTGATAALAVLGALLRAVTVELERSPTPKETTNG